MGIMWTVDLTMANRLLKGHDNLTPPKERAIAVDPHMLLHIREVVRKDRVMSKHDKRAIWMLCCFMWNGSFRVGELLSSTEMGFVERQTLLGKRLLKKFGSWKGKKQEFLVVRLLDPKESREKSRALVDVEMFSCESFHNPVEALSKFMERSLFPINPDLPVFR